jgi:hypothetical protein
MGQTVQVAARQDSPPQEEPVHVSALPFVFRPIPALRRSLTTETKFEREVMKPGEMLGVIQSHKATRRTFSPGFVASCLIGNHFFGGRIMGTPRPAALGPFCLENPRRGRHSSRKQRSSCALEVYHFEVYHYAYISSHAATISTVQNERSLFNRSLSSFSFSRSAARLHLPAKRQQAR